MSNALGKASLEITQKRKKTGCFKCGSRFANGFGLKVTGEVTIGGQRHLVADFGWCSAVLCGAGEDA